MLDDNELSVLKLLRGVCLKDVAEVFRAIRRHHDRHGAEESGRCTRLRWSP